MVNTLNSRLDPLIVGKWLSVPQLGLFQLGHNLALLPTREIAVPIRKIAYPGLAAVLKSSEAQGDCARIRMAYQKTRGITNTATLFVGICFALVADTLIAALLNAQWQATVYIVQWLSAALAIQTMGTISHPLAMACGETRLLFLRNLIVFFLRMPVLLLGLALFGLPGIVGARVITTLIIVFVDMDLARRLIGLSILAQLKINLRAFVSIGVMASGVWALKSVVGELDDRALLIAQLAAEVLLGSILYFGSLTLLWRFAGRPDGPESELGKLVLKIYARRSPL